MSSKKKVDKRSNVGVMDREDEKVQKPRKFKAVMLNDDFTPMDVVVLILQEVFRKSSAEATRLMLDVHNKGRGIAGVYSHEICETKCAHAVGLAKTLGFPFLVEPEPE